MISLGLLLHVYQPPDRFDDLLHRVVRESHRPLLRLLQGRPDARVSLNLNWCLTEKWLEKGFEDCVESLDSLLRWERVELTGSAAYHPILPLIPRHEIRRQISYNSERHQEVFSNWKPQGFFPPELAFGHELPPVLVDLGFEWCLADDIPYTCLHDVPPFDFVPVCADLPVLLRSSLWSKTFEACARHGADGKALVRKLVEDLNGWFDGKDGYVIIALEADALGEHRSGSLDRCLLGFLDELAKQSDQIQLRHVGEIASEFPHQPSDIPPGSWSTTVEDFWAGEFFPLWQSRYNNAHKLLWELTDLAVSSVARLQTKLDRSLNSGTFWWATRETGELPASTSRGMKMLLDVIATAAPDNMNRALDLMAQLDTLFEDQAS
ncbi:MAG: hypothetical protein AB7S38_36040, partial [Vulcanimicrobiota bacterium]